MAKQHPLITYRRLKLLSGSGWTIGSSGSNRGFNFPQYGNLSPRVFEGTVAVSLRADSSGIFDLTFDGNAAPAGNAGTFIVTVAGAPGSPFTLTYDTGNGDYRLDTGNTDLFNWCDARVGQTIPVSVELGTYAEAAGDPEVVSASAGSPTEVGYISGTQGSFNNADAAEFGGETLTRFTIQDNGGTRPIWIDFGGNQINGWSSIQCTLGGNNVNGINWDGTRYYTANGFTISQRAAALTHLQANLGVAVATNIEQYVP